MTKVQKRNEISIKALEKHFNDLMEYLRLQNDNRKFLKKHATSVAEVQGMIGAVNGRLRPKDTGPLLW